MVPANQRLEPDQLLGLGIDQRLEDEMELLGGDRAAKVGFKPDPVFLLRLQLRREVARAAAAGVFRLVEREVGLEDQVVDGRAVDRPERAADRDADADLGLVDHVGFLDRLDDPVGELLDLLAALRVVDDDRELVAAHAADVPSAATSSTRRLATARSTASPLGWPKVSLTGLKPSRSRNMIAHGTLPRSRRAAPRQAAGEPGRG